MILILDLMMIYMFLIMIQVWNLEDLTKRAKQLELQVQLVDVRFFLDGRGIQINLPGGVQDQLIIQMQKTQVLLLIILYTLLLLLRLTEQYIYLRAHSLVVLLAVKYIV